MENSQLTSSRMKSAVNQALKTLSAYSSGRKRIKNGILCGKFMKNTIGSECSILLDSGEYYYGQFNKNIISGFGIVVLRNGCIIKGSFLEGKVHGLGQIEFSNQEIIRGFFSQGKLQGRYLKKNVGVNEWKWKSSYSSNQFSSSEDFSRKAEEKTLTQSAYDIYFVDTILSQQLREYKILKVEGMSQIGQRQLGVVIRRKDDFGNIQIGFFNEQMKLDGRGRMHLQGQDCYDGYFRDSFFHGKGVYSTGKDSTWIAGQFSHNRISYAFRQGHGFPPPLFSNLQTVGEQIKTNVYSIGEVFSEEEEQMGIGEDLPQIECAPLCTKLLLKCLLSKSAPIPEGAEVLKFLKQPTESCPKLNERSKSPQQMEKHSEQAQKKKIEQMRSNSKRELVAEEPSNQPSQLLSRSTKQNNLLSKEQKEAKLNQQNKLLQENDISDNNNSLHSCPTDTPKTNNIERDSENATHSKVRASPYNRSTEKSNSPSQNKEDQDSSSQNQPQPSLKSEDIQIAIQTNTKKSHNSVLESTANKEMPHFSIFASKQSLIERGRQAALNSQQSNNQASSSSFLQHSIDKTTVDKTLSIPIAVKSFQSSISVKSFSLNPTPPIPPSAGTTAQNIPQKEQKKQTVWSNENNNNNDHNNIEEEQEQENNVKESLDESPQEQKHQSNSPLNSSFEIKNKLETEKNSINPLQNEALKQMHLNDQKEPVSSKNIPQKQVEEVKIQKNLKKSSSFINNNHNNSSSNNNSSISYNKNNSSNNCKRIIKDQQCFIDEKQVDSLIETSRSKFETGLPQQQSTQNSQLDKILESQQQNQQSQVNPQLLSKNSSTMSLQQSRSFSNSIQHIHNIASHNFSRKSSTGNPQNQNQSVSSSRGHSHQGSNAEFLHHSSKMHLDMKDCWENKSENNMMRFLEQSVPNVSRKLFEIENSLEEGRLRQDGYLTYNNSYKIKEGQKSNQSRQESVSPTRNGSSRIKKEDNPLKHEGVPHKQEAINYKIDHPIEVFEKIKLKSSKNSSLSSKQNTSKQKSDKAYLKQQDKNLTREENRSLKKQEKNLSYLEQKSKDKQEASHKSNKRLDLKGIRCFEEVTTPQSQVNNQCQTSFSSNSNPQNILTQTSSAQYGHTLIAPYMKTEPHASSSFVWDTSQRVGTDSPACSYVGMMSSIYKNHLFEKNTNQEEVNKKGAQVLHSSQYQQNEFGLKELKQRKIHEIPSNTLNSFGYGKCFQNGKQDQKNNSSLNNQDTSAENIHRKQKHQHHQSQSHLQTEKSLEKLQLQLSLERGKVKLSNTITTKSSSKKKKKNKSSSSTTLSASGQSQKKLKNSPLKSAITTTPTRK